jgi:hypothetical protein
MDPSGAPSVKNHGHGIAFVCAILLELLDEMIPFGFQVAAQSFFTSYKIVTVYDNMKGHLVLLWLKRFYRVMKAVVKTVKNR